MDEDDVIRLRRPMQARSFLTAVAAAVLSLVLLATGLLWGLQQRSPVHLVDQPLQLPRAARFVPRDAALSLHWLADPARLPAYVQAVAPARQRRTARDGMRQWRDGAFALAGLEFESELASWLGPELSLTLLDSQDAPGWVLALTSRDSDGARRFLQRFWQTRSLAGTDLQISSYRGMGLISGRGALLGRQPQPLATALIDDDLLLLASGRGVLERVLDVSQLQQQHQLGDDDLQRQVAGLGHGAAVLTASPQALRQWFDLPDGLAGLDGLVAAVQAEAADLVVDGRLRFRDPTPAADWPRGSDLVAGAGGKAGLMAQLHNPSRLLDPAEPHPMAQWLGPLLKARLGQDPTALTLAGLDDGPLLWQQQSDGWLLATASHHPDLDVVDDQLKAQGLARSELSGDGERTQVWTRLTRQRGRQAGVEAQLAVARATAADADWWGETLPALAARRDGHALEPRLQQWRWLSRGQQTPTQSLMLASQPAQKLLAQWQPWNLMQAMAGQALLPRIQGLSLGLDADRQDDGSTVLPLHARLELG